LVNADQFRTTMKYGRKVAAEHLVIYLKRDSAQPVSRFGFVVAKSVGGAVQRNLVKRRMRAIAREIISLQSESYDLVARALPGAAQAPWNKLREEFLNATEVAGREKSKS
jgi:ribonuclease P protein component